MTKILIVDDNPATLNALKAGLISLDYQVVVAKEGPQALEIIKTSTQEAEPVDLMVTDLRMPGMNGLELIRSAKKMKPGLACILMTAFGNNDVQREVMAFRSSGYIEKPFTLQGLLQVIKTFKN
jgi:CheY-like chemotaxis protein